MRCPACDLGVAGEWKACPLCSGPLEGAPTTSPHPDIPLRYERRKLLMGLAAASLFLIAGSLIAVRFFPGPIRGFSLVWFVLAAVWLLTLTVVRKRRNVAKVIVYGVAVASLLSLYADYLRGWEGWSIDWVIPLLCSASVVAIFVAVRIARMPVADYIIYLWSAALLGLLPALGLIFGYTGVTIPSWISIGLAAIAAALSLILHRSEAATELRKRFSI